MFDYQRVRNMDQHWLKAQMEIKGLRLKMIQTRVGNPKPLLKHCRCLAVKCRLQGYIPMLLATAKQNVYLNHILMTLCFVQ